MQREAETRATALQKALDDDQNWESGEDTDHEEEEQKFDPEEALLFVYICTHVAEITKGKATAGTYVVMSDTSWMSKEALAGSALRLETFTSAIADIPVCT